MRSIHLMRPALRLAIAAWTGLAAGSSMADNPAGRGTDRAGRPAVLDRYDFSGYLVERQVEESARRAEEDVQVRVVSVRGVEFLRMDTVAGHLYVPKTDRLTRESLLQGRCTRTFKPADLAQASDSAAALETEHQVRNLASGILKVVRSACTPATAGP